MRTIAPIVVVLAIGVAAMMLGMSGFSAAWGADPPQTSAAQEELEDSSRDLAPQSGPVSGPVSGVDDSVIGLLASGLGSAVDVAGAGAVLPKALISLGFPAWFATPVGFLAQLIVGIGLFEFATSREWT